MLWSISHCIPVLPGNIFIRKWTYKDSFWIGLSDRKHGLFTVIFMQIIMRKSLKGFPQVMWDIRHKILKVHVSCWLHNGLNRKTNTKLHIILNTVYNTWRVTSNAILLSINLFISMMLTDLNHPFRLSYPFPESSLKKRIFLDFTSYERASSLLWIMYDLMSTGNSGKYFYKTCIHSYSEQLNCS